MHRLPAATVLVAAALVAATGCVSVSPQPTGHGRQHSLSRPAGPVGPGRAREALVDIGPDASGGPPGDPSRDPTSHAPPGTPTDGWSPEDPRDPRPPRDPADPAPADPAGPREPVDRSHTSHGSRPSESAKSPPGNSSSPSRDSGRGETSGRPPEPPSRPAPAGEDSPLPRNPPQAPPTSGRAAEPRQAPPRSSGGGVCSLGRTYGHWEQGSDASRICGQVYGH
ncbi:hypothetical protein [Streptomyces sp. NPDC020667]|uniref:hypothetical protein n=1 Tax=Streptomyces sp. NPDC020667 TaxID=3154895 RepID=UPI003401BA14